MTQTSEDAEKELAEEVADDEFNVQSTAALISALLLNLAFSAGGTDLDLSSVCEDWGNELCQECANIWGTCAATRTLVDIYKTFAHICTIWCYTCVATSVALMINFQCIPRRRSHTFRAMLRWRAYIPVTCMSLGTCSGVAAAVVQMSVSSKPEVFSMLAMCIVVALIVWLINEVGLQLARRKIRSEVTPQADRSKS